MTAGGDPGLDAVTTDRTREGMPPGPANAPPMATQTLAPWFFRQRFTIFGAVYGVGFLAGFIIAGLAGIAPTPAFASSQVPEVVASIAALCIAGGYALRVWASSYIAASIVWTQDVQLGELRVSGPYRYTRNPLYLGNLLQAVGIGALGPWPVTVLVVILMLAYTFVLISVEERFLAEKNGAGYNAYKAQVPRLFPMPGRHADDARQPASVRAGLRSESMIGAITVAAIIDIGWLVTQLHGQRS